MQLLPVARGGVIAKQVTSMLDPAADSSLKHDDTTFVSFVRSR